jgi:EAL domain-containing protein (putative c-di-GMP-specific phosphodiesterase class I)
MTSRDLADDPYVGPLADPAWPGGSASHATLQNQPVFVGQRGEKPIEAALDDRMLLTAFQPIRELTAGHVKGFEALARFVTGERTGTAAWFRGAAAMGLGPDLEIAALHCALFAAREIPAPLFVAFNLSPATCADPRVPALLLDGGVAPDRIVIEITGQVADGELNDLTAAVEPLRRRGLRLAVDGSGAAAASAVQILQLRPDIIKLDRNFLDSVLGSTETADALPAVFELALQTGALLSAEGIESHAELAAVTGLGVATGQGYLLGRPSVDPLDWAAWILQADTPGAQHDL